MKDSEARNQWSLDRKGNVRKYWRSVSKQCREIWKDRETITTKDT